MVEMTYARIERMLQFDFLRLVIAHRIAAFDRPGIGDHSRLVEQGFGDSGLAAAGVTH